MLIALLVILAFALLAGLRAYSLIGRDGAVHYAGSRTEEGVRDQKRLRWKLGLPRTARVVDDPEQKQELYGIYMRNRPTVITRRKLRLPQKDPNHA